MKNRLRFVLTFMSVCIIGVYLHEIGHAVAGWVQGIAIVPTPAKEYVLRDQVDWTHQIWISLGGVAGTTLLVLGTLVWYVRQQRPKADAVLAGVLLPPCVYTIRFLLVGRGHDGLEWQEAQSALGMDPAGHAVDILFLGLFFAGVGVWLVRRRFSLRLATFGRAVALMLGGIVLLLVLQVGNNALFDPFFPETTTVNVPADLESR